MDKLVKEKYYKTKEMLNNYLLYKAKIFDLMLENQMLNTNVGVQALQYKEATCKTYKINSSVEDTIINNQIKIEKNKKDIEFFECHIRKIDNAIQILDNKFEKEVIIEKFLNSKTSSWKDVSIKLNSSVEVCRKASRRVINKLSIFLF